LFPVKGEEFLKISESGSLWGGQRAGIPGSVERVSSWSANLPCTWLVPRLLGRVIAKIGKVKVSTPK